MNRRQRFTIALTLMAFVLAVIETTTRTSLGSVTPSGKDLIPVANSSGSMTESLGALPDGSANFAVEFTNCVESIGVTLVPTDKARALVPPEFHLVGEAAPVTPLVVRTARCDIAVGGQSPNTGSITQVGLVIVPPDFTGDINNYTLWYYTTDAELANHLVRLGVGAQHVQNITYGYVPGAMGSPVPFLVNVPRPGDPMFSLAGTVTRSEIPSGSFVANWWQSGRRGSVKMNTDVPAICIGGANLTLTTDPNNELGQLIGGGSTGFAIVQQFNTFITAHMEVSVVAP
jgi:hypothetical protein